MGGGRGTRLAALTQERSKLAVPIGGKYRLVDIPINNAIHSGMERMVLLTQYNAHSLHRHITRTYRFDAFSRGYVHILAAQQTPQGDRWFQGPADAVKCNLMHIDHMAEDLILILAGDHMYKMDYRDMVRDHVESGAEVTVAVQPCSEEEGAGCGALRVDASGRIIEFREKPKTAEEREGMALEPQWLAARRLSRDTPYLASMGIYLFNKSVLVQALESDPVDFGKHVIPASVDTRHVHAHFFTGYWRDIGTVRSFYEAHMDLVSDEPQFRFDDPRWPFYTHPRYLPCARLSRSTFDRSMLAEAVVVTDSVVRDSIIGVRTPITGATIEKCLLMGCDPDPPTNVPADAPPLGIGEGSIIRNAIIDKNARIGRGVHIVNEAGLKEATGQGRSIHDGITVVAKNTIIPDGTII